MPRVERSQNHGLFDDPPDAESGNRREPDDDDGTEESADAMRAVPLNEEEANQNRDGQRHDIRTEQRCGNLETFNRAEHRNRRRDHAVAVQQSGSEDAERNQDRAPFGETSRDSAGPPEAGHQRSQREDAPFALVVGAHNESDVLDRDDEDKRVDDERQDAEHVLVRRRDGMRTEEALPHCVQRTGTDVSIDDTEGGQRQRQEATARAGGV